MKILTFSLICVLSLAVFGCERDNGVRAGREDGVTATYKPRPAPPAPAAPNTDTGLATGTMAEQELKGQVIRVDNNNKTIVVRVENGMEQTLKFDENTTVSGMSMVQNQNMQNIRNLKPGSDVAVRWRGSAADKMASSIMVTNAGQTNQPQKQKTPQKRY